MSFWQNSRKISEDVLTRISGETLAEILRLVPAKICGRFPERIFGGNLAGISAGAGAISTYISSWIPVRTPAGMFREINEGIHGGMPGGISVEVFGEIPPIILGEFLQILNKS